MTEPVPEQSIPDVALAGPHFLVFKFSLRSKGDVRWGVGAVPAQTARIFVGGEKTVIVDMLPCLAADGGLSDNYVLDPNDPVEIVPATMVPFRLYTLRDQLAQEGTLAGDPLPPPPTPAKGPAGKQLPGNPVLQIPRRPDKP